MKENDEKRNVPTGEPVEWMHVDGKHKEEGMGHVEGGKREEEGQPTNLLGLKEKVRNKLCQRVSWHR